jgi:hypothetical protein
MRIDHVGPSLVALALLLVFAGGVADASTSPQPDGNTHPHLQERWEVRSTKLGLNGKSFELIVRFLPGEEAWADHVTAFAPQAIPVLEQVIGAPYPGPPALRITQRSGAEIYGAAGVAACGDGLCGIAVDPASDDRVLLHEIAHVWTYAFRNRWLAEGTADFAAIEAAARLGIRVRDGPIRDFSPPIYSLDHWGNPVNFDTSDAETLAREYEGYDRATRLVQIFRERNEAALHNAFAALVDDPQVSVESEHFMDAFEDAGAGNMDDLFRDWVFAEDMHPAIAERRAARDGLAALRTRIASQTPELTPNAPGLIGQQIGQWQFAEASQALAVANAGMDAYVPLRDRLNAFRTVAEQAGLPYPVNFEQAKASLDFAPVAASIDQGDQAVSAYIAARDKLLAKRSLSQEIGLFGKDPDSELKQARDAFASGLFEESINSSHAAEATLADASQDATRNLLVGAAVLLALIVGALFALRWAFSGQPQPAGSEG